VAAAPAVAEAPKKRGRPPKAATAAKEKPKDAKKKPKK
jgi:hypothetical protein